MSKWYKQIPLQRNSNGQEIYENVDTIIRHPGHTNQDLTSVRMVIVKKAEKKKKECWEGCGQNEPKYNASGNAN